VGGRDTKFERREQRLLKIDNSVLFGHRLTHVEQMNYETMKDDDNSRTESGGRIQEFKYYLNVPKILESINISFIVLMFVEHTHQQPRKSTQLKK
jgi:hypothetical protein